MRVDHIIFASGPQGIKADVACLAEQLGADFKEGGFHPRFGTRNCIIPLANSRYLEVVEDATSRTKARETSRALICAYRVVGGRR